ncbi:MAG: leucyl/phenylalanyl-tRNA--protein transferase [Magnetococcales bacterium]|nr:leucyl/phenylalanyl-tRNA--protein transferase [Magnetococcales bacterium]MBF0321546.1 leucyl/phenylalanyl-tRNA--protein transferase [Magnetococcales bacterium]
MPVFRLPKENHFPPVELAEPNGLLAVGGDLSVHRLITAYRYGIFPWYAAGEPLLWWSPDPRMILKPAWFHLPKSLRKGLRQGRFLLTLDQAFPEVIQACGETRREKGTWITPEMAAAYIRLHAIGFAHSAEAWQQETTGTRLVGGVYGVTIGGCFFGESMFFREPDASKCAFAFLMATLKQKGFTLIDCQMHTPHLARFGAREVPRSQFLLDLKKALVQPIPQESWRGGASGQLF